MTNHPLFGLVLVFLSYTGIQFIQKKLKLKFLNPLLFSSILIILFLLLSKIPYEDFNRSASFLTHLIGPATVALAIPLYEKKQYIKQFPKTIILSTLLGTLIHLITIVGLAKAIQLDNNILASVLPKSVTTAIAIDVSRTLGGITNLTVAIVVITGILGTSLFSLYNKLFGIKQPIAQGLAMGTAAHAVGTSKAAEISDTHASMSALALIITGIWTVILLPLIFPFL